MTHEEMSRKGGKARAKKLSKKQRVAIAKKGAAARHAKKKGPTNQIQRTPLG